MKVFASDFDNTLHFMDRTGGYFRSGDLSAILDFQDHGGLFGLCTGRPLFGFGNDLDHGPKLDFVVASSGAVVAEKKEDTFVPVFESVLTTKQIAMLDETFGKESIFYIHADGHIFTLYERRPQYPQQTVLPSIDALNGRHITCVSVWTPSNRTASLIAARINAMYGKEMAGYQNTQWIDVVHAGVSKGTGVLHAKQLLHGDVIAGIGDSFNDIPLLEAADISFSFHASEDEVKEKADYLVDTVAEALAIFAKI